MISLAPTLVAFVVGLTACGLVGSMMESISGRKLAFAEPYVSPSHVLRSLVTTACAGPFMLLNDALDARRDGRISMMMLMSCACTAIAWTVALGVVVLAIASWAVRLLGSGLPA